MLCCCRRDCRASTRRWARRSRRRSRSRGSRMCRHPGSGTWPRPRMPSRSCRNRSRCGTDSAPSRDHHRRRVHPGLHRHHFRPEPCAGLFFFVPELGGNFSLANILAPNNLGGLIGGVLFGLAFFVVGAVMLGFWVRTMLGRVRPVLPEVTLSSQSVRVGDTVTLATSRPSARPRTCRASNSNCCCANGPPTGAAPIPSRCGTTTWPRITQLPGAGATRPAKGFQEQRRSRCSGMHTFSANHNELIWLIKVQVEHGRAGRGVRGGISAASGA